MGTRKTRHPSRKKSHAATHRAAVKAAKGAARGKVSETAAMDVSVPCMVVVSGKRPGSVFKLEEGATTLGSSERADAVIEDTRVSGIHCQIYNEGNETVKVEDMDSTNGTFLDSARIYMQELSPQSLLHIGRTILRLEFRPYSSVQDVGWSFPEPYDEVTGVMSRYFFLDRMHEEWAYLSRMNSEMFMLMVAIDEPEKIRDSYGQEALDHVNNRIATILFHEKRREDVLGRYDEDLFAIMPRGIDHDGIIKFAGRLLQMIQSAIITYEGAPIFATVSIGVAGKNAQDMSQFSELLKKCEKIRNTAIERGGNQVAADIL